MLDYKIHDMPPSGGKRYFLPAISDGKKILAFGYEVESIAQACNWIQQKVLSLKKIKVSV